MKTTVFALLLSIAACAAQSFDFNQPYTVVVAPDAPTAAQADAMLDEQRRITAALEKIVAQQKEAAAAAKFAAEQQQLAESYRANREATDKFNAEMSQRLARAALEYEARKGK